MAKNKYVQAPDNPTYNYINNDFTGYRSIDNNQELVEYYGQSTHRIWLNDLSVEYPTHWHSAIEIIMPVENYYTVTSNNIEYKVDEGQIIIIPPGMLHKLEAPECGKRFVFIMDIENISKLKGFAGIATILSQPLLITKETHPIIYDDIYDLLVQIRNEYYRNSEYSELAIEALLLNLFIKIGENHSNAIELFPNVRPNKHKDYVQRFNQLLEYINEHYAEELCLDDMAQMAGFSKYHFSRLFKQYSDYTFCDYLTYRRIKAATEFLSDPDYSITDAAMDAGFQSISTFNRLFKQQIGCTPREYRSKNTHLQSNYS